jgi:hypothetical protein
MGEFDKLQQIAKEIISSSEIKDTDESEIIDVSLATDRINIEKNKFDILNALEAMRKEHQCEIVKIALEKYIKSEISEMISIINRRYCELEDKNTKYFSKSPKTKKYDVITQDGYILLGITGTKEMMESLEYTILREIDCNGFISFEDLKIDDNNLLKNLISDNKVSTLATPKDFKERMLPSTVSCDFISEDKKRNEEYLKTLEKIKSEESKKTPIKNTKRKSSNKKGKK